MLGRILSLYLSIQLAYMPPWRTHNPVLVLDTRSIG